jgi:hypothetical protein
MAYSFGGQTYGGTPQGSFAGQGYGGWSGGLSIDRSGGREPSFFGPNAKGGGYGGWSGGVKVATDWNRNNIFGWLAAKRAAAKRPPRPAPPKPKPPAPGVARYNAVQAAKKPQTPNIYDAGIAGVLAARQHARINARLAKAWPERWAHINRLRIQAATGIPFRNQEVPLSRVRGRPLKGRAWNSGIARAAAHLALGKPTRRGKRR